MTITKQLTSAEKHGIHAILNEEKSNLKFEYEVMHSLNECISLNLQNQNWRLVNFNRKTLDPNMEQTEINHSKRSSS